LALVEGGADQPSGFAQVPLGFRAHVVPVEDVREGGVGDIGVDVENGLDQRVPRSLIDY
jgi:hypothetical protein